MRLPVVKAALLVGLLVGCAHHPKPASTPAEDAQYHTLYGKPLTSLGAKYAQLTPAAQATVLAEAGSAQIYDVLKENRNGVVFFVVHFRDSKIFPPLYILPDGSVLKPDLSVLVAAPKEVSPLSSVIVGLNELPSEVQKTLMARAEGAQVAFISREPWGDHTVYVVTFKDEAHPKLYITVEGSQLPPAAQKTLLEQVPGAQVASVIKDSWGDRTVYIVMFKDELHHPKLYITAEGALLHPAVAK